MANDEFQDKSRERGSSPACKPRFDHTANAFPMIDLRCKTEVTLGRSDVERAPLRRRTPVIEVKPRRRSTVVCSRGSNLLKRHLLRMGNEIIKFAPCHREAGGDGCVSASWMNLGGSSTPSRALCSVADATT